MLTNAVQPSSPSPSLRTPVSATKAECRAFWSCPKGGTGAAGAPVALVALLAAGGSEGGAGGGSLIGNGDPEPKRS